MSVLREANLSRRILLIPGAVDRFELEVPGLYWLEVFLPYLVDDEEMECAYNKVIDRFPILGYMYH